MVYSLWAYILMGAGYDIPRAGLTSLVQNRKETNMSKEDEQDKLNLDLSKYSTGSYDSITVTNWENHINGIKESDLTVTMGDQPLSSLNTDSLTTVTLKEVEFDFQNTDTVTINTDVKQGDLFNGWPEDGPPSPGVTITLKEGE